MPNIALVTLLILLLLPLPTSTSATSTTDMGETERDDKSRTLSLGPLLLLGGLFSRLASVFHPLSSVLSSSWAHTILSVDLVVQREQASNAAEVSRPSVKLSGE